jgi:hypothetical protein
MTPDNSPNPYQSPGSEQPPEARTPTLRDIVGTTIVALLAGGTVILGTCFGTTLMRVSFTDPRAAPKWAGPEWAGRALLFVFGALGVSTALFVARRLYRGWVTTPDPVTEYGSTAATPTVAQNLLTIHMKRHRLLQVTK